MTTTITAQHQQRQIEAMRRWAVLVKYRYSDELPLLLRKWDVVTLVEYTVCVRSCSCLMTAARRNQDTISGALAIPAHAAVATHGGKHQHAVQVACRLAPPAFVGAEHKHLPHSQRTTLDCSCREQKGMTPPG
jgi:hypothetical protein